VTNARLRRLKARGEALNSDTYALYLAYRDPRVSWWARAWALLVVAYALSPVDFIPDFIPVLGYLDDLVLVPLGITLALRMIPAEVMAESRARAAEVLGGKRPAAARAVGLMIAALWLALLGWLVWQAVQSCSR